MVEPMFGLAPMAGYSDKAMRTLVRRFGCDLVVTEMVSAKALTFGNAKSFDLLDITSEKDPVYVQLFGGEPKVMAKAARLAVEKGVKYLDVNMGCPVPKVVRNGEGAALLLQPNTAQAIIREMTATVDVPVSVKIRIGWDQPLKDLADFAAGLAAAGAAKICVHGRTRAQYYNGQADWKQIREVVEAVDIPVFANGDVVNVETGLAIIKQTGAAGAFIGRGALGRPWLFAQLRAACGQQAIPEDPTLEQRVELIKEHARLAIADKGEVRAMLELRKILGWYVKGLPGAVDFRRELSNLSQFSQLEHILEHWRMTWSSN